MIRCSCGRRAHGKAKVNDDEDKTVTFICANYSPSREKGCKEKPQNIKRPKGVRIGGSVHWTKKGIL